MDDWRTWDLKKREREFSPSSCAPDFLQIVQRYRSASDAVFGAAWRLAPYGSSDDEIVALFAPHGDAAPLHVFIHGGYWQELSWRDALFCAPDCAAQGVNFAAINYTLAPLARVEAIVDQCRRALIFLRANFCGPIILSGSSAGAHLAAIMMLHDWVGEGQPCPIAANVLLSGVYDLEPLVGTSINAPLKLDADAARALSPQHMLRAFGRAINCIPTLIAFGDNETNAFKAQSKAFRNAIANVGGRAALMEVKDRNHFDLPFDLGRPQTQLGAAVAKLHEGRSLP